MNKINLKQKLTSRKLWIAVVGIIVGIAMAFGIEENEYAELAGAITSIVSIVTYIFGESKVDAARIENETKTDISAEIDRLKRTSETT